MLHSFSAEMVVDFSNVKGKCYLMNSENLQVSESEWVSGGPDRFYFSQAYDAKAQTFDDLPSKAASVGSKGKVGRCFKQWVH